MTTCVYIWLVIVCASKFHNLISGGARTSHSFMLYLKSKKRKEARRSVRILPELEMFCTESLTRAPNHLTNKTPFWQQPLLQFSVRTTQNYDTSISVVGSERKINSVRFFFLLLVFYYIRHFLCISHYFNFSLFLTHSLVQINSSYLNMACCYKPIIIC